MQTPVASLELAQKYHRAGDLQRAEQVYRGVLANDPANALAYSLLGVVAHQQGRLQAAVESLQKAVALDASNPRYPYQLGIILHGAGRLGEAIAGYQLALRLKPDFAEAHNSLAVALAAQGKTEEARAHYTQALAANPNYAEVHNNLGILLRQQRDSAGAIASYREALRLSPGSAVFHNNLGLVQLDLKKLADAEASFREALKLLPGFAEGHNNLGLCLEKLGRLEEAIVSFRTAVTLKPAYVEAHDNLGVVFAAANHFAEAVTSHERALQLKPDYAVAHHNLGNVLRGHGQLDQAIASFKKALELRPDYAEAHINLGIALRDSGQGAAAIAQFEQAARLKPDSAELYNNWGVALFGTGHVDQALGKYEMALRLNPDFAEAHVNRALACLQNGDWHRGWPEFEWRSKMKGMPQRQWLRPAWQGDALEGRTILLSAEQGLGDTIQFVRYVELVRERGGLVLLECPKALGRLLASCPGIDRIVTETANPADYEYQASLLSLPLVFGTTLTSIPSSVPYIHAEPSLIERWQQELACVTELKVGIAWQGSLNYRWDRQRSIPLIEFAPLAAVPGVRLLSLQKGFGSEQVASAAGRLQIMDLSKRLDVEAGAFMDTAAVMTNLDLVITSDTATAHLAGALGVPVWVALPFVADWRWLREREDCPWYPTMRLFRQHRPGDWAEVFERLASELRRLSPHNRGKYPVSCAGTETEAPVALKNESTMPQALFRPEIFEVSSVKEAMAVVVTPQAGTTSEERWEKETPYLVEDIIKRLAIGPESCVLDYGCGIGRVAKGLIEKSGCRVIGVDTSKAMQLMAPEYVLSERFVVWSPGVLEKVIERGFRADFAVCIWVIQHALDPAKVIHEIARALRPSGLLYALNLTTRCVPTNRGWLNDGFDVRSALREAFHEEDLHSLPETVATAQVASLSMIQVLRKH
jgi:tetratricopeptide (TPR) repeat protein